MFLSGLYLCERQWYARWRQKWTPKGDMFKSAPQTPAANVYSAHRNGRVATGKYEANQGEQE